MWESALLERVTVAENTVECVLRRPAGFTHRAGQYVEMLLPHPAFGDALGPSRAMSIASAPSEDDLRVVMRIRDSAFKRSVMALRRGAPVMLDGPAEDLRFDADLGRPIVLLAGGVGIAPFRAFLREAVARGRRLHGALLYSNRRPEDAAYLGEMSRLAPAAGLRFVPTMTGMAEARLPWSGATERLCAAMSHRHVDPACGARYFVSGSTTFVSGLCYDLEQHGVRPSDIAVEMYAGY